MFNILYSTILGTKKEWVWLMKVYHLKPTVSDNEAQIIDPKHLQKVATDFQKNYLTEF